jgi:meiotically up-regulated gene 157 (Mug157) protein
MDSTALYTRPWFAWANGFFAEFVIKIMTSQPQLVLGERRLEPEIGLVA